MGWSKASLFQPFFFFLCFYCGIHTHTHTGGISLELADFKGYLIKILQSRGSIGRQWSEENAFFMFYSPVFSLLSCLVTGFRLTTLNDRLLKRGHHLLKANEESERGRNWHPPTLPPSSSFLPLTLFTPQPLMPSALPTGGHLCLCQEADKDPGVSLEYGRAQRSHLGRRCRDT